MASTYLERTQSGTETDSKKSTLSVWIKLSKVPDSSTAMGIFGTHVSGNYGADGNSQLGFYQGGLYAWFKDGGSTYYKQESTRRFRDNNAWYHVVYRFDMTQSTASNRIRIYLNGEEVTSFASSNNPGSTQNIQMNNGGRIVRVGTYNFLNGTHNYLDGLMSHFYFCDGYSYAPTEFGETDSTTGEWKIKPDPSLTYGNNGFWLFKNDNAVTNRAAGTSSGDFTVSGGTFTKTEDNPSNVFATFNPLNVPTSNAPNFAAGNTDLDSAGNAGLFHGSSTLGMLSGKFYAEFKWKSNNYAVAGVSSRARNDARENKRPGAENGSYGFELYNGNVKVNNSTIGGFSGSSLSIGDILCIAIDCDNNKLYFRKNGDAWMNSGDPTSGSTGTGALSLTAATGGDYDGFWFFVIGDGDTSSSSKISANFGNGYFLTTAVSSAGTNASGNGIFEYDVPTGYTALSTKGLNT